MNSTIKPSLCKTCGSKFHSAMWHKPRKPIETMPHCDTCGSERHYTSTCPANRKAIKPKGREAANWYAFKVQWMKQNDQTAVCHYCGIRLKPESITLDHKIPRSRAPELRYELSNLVPCCFTCNGLKGSIEHDKYPHNCNDRIPA